MDWTFEAKVGLAIAIFIVYALLKLIWSIGASRND
jgi:hypothetical protein